LRELADILALQLTVAGIDDPKPQCRFPGQTAQKPASENSWQAFLTIQTIHLMNFEKSDTLAPLKRT
jgi:hypothetical protein